MDAAALAQRIRAIPDFPKPGILFRDVTPLLLDPAAFHGAAEAMAEPFRTLGVERVLGIESRGFLFAARSVAPEEFYASFTFLQEHLTYQPDATDARQLGVLQGRLGALAAGEVVLGYISLPPNFDPAADLDIYWDDRHTTVQFAR